MPRRVRTVGWVLSALALGTAPLLVLASPAGATDVADETALRAAFGSAAETTIVLTADIELTNCGTGEVARNSATAITVTGNGHTVHQTCAGKNTFVQNGIGALTFDGVNIGMAANTNGVASFGAVTLTNSSITNVANGDGISADAPVTLTNSQITDVNGGDGISAGGAVTLTGSQITDVGDGDGISTGSVVTLTDSSITGVTDGDGISSGDNVTLTRSFITGDPNGDCDGISTGGDTTTLVASTVVGCFDGISAGGSVFLTNSTISGAGVNGLSIGGTAHLVLSTIAGSGDTNISSDGLEAQGSVIAKSATGTNCEIPGTISHGYNFDDDGTCDFDQSTDHSDGGNPLLGTLANNGGPTPTMLPQAGSPLLNQIPPASCPQPTDQRGVTRPQGPACDIGAVEVEVAAPPAPVVQQPNFTG